MNKHSILLAIISIVIGTVSCQSGNQIRSNDLVVKEQTDTVCGGNEDNRHEWAAFTIDAPVNGPKVLVDSVIAFINRELYDACESNAHFNEKIVSFSKAKMFTNDGERLLSRYLEKYKPLIQDSLWRVFGLTMKMEAQTEKYVTYGLEFFYCGAGSSSQKEYYTFDKRDGHQLKEIISHKNLVRFFEDYPEYNSIGADAWSGSPEWEFSPEQGFDNTCYGLLDDRFMLVIGGYGNNYLMTDFPYSQIFSYLTPEAQTLLEKKSEEEPMLPAYYPKYSEDGQVWMETDTVNHEIIGFISAAGGPHGSTLIEYDPVQDAYPKRVHAIDAEGGNTIFLFIYSQGYLLHYDEALTCDIDEDNFLRPIALFPVEGRKDSIVGSMWYDQLVAASDGFPFYELDQERFGIHFDSYTKRLYVPIMEHHEKGSEFENCLRYTGRYEVLQFNGKEFVPAGTDGAWWLNPDLRNYKRTVSNRKSEKGIEQIDLMPDGSHRRAIWKNAKTLDDLRKKPDEVTTI